MAGVRPFQESDIVPVADLVWRVLHAQQGGSPASLKDYFSELFLRNPWRQDGIISYVYEDSQGTLVGFFGAVPRRMTIKGRTISLAFGSNFVMDPSSRASMAAIQLVRTFMKGTQDVSITDSATEDSKRVLRSLGFNVVPVYSLKWARPLRPSRYALQGLTRQSKRKGLAAASAILKPVCAVADMLATKIPASPLRQRSPETTTEHLDTDTLLELLSKIPAKNLLLPEYDRTSLDWLLKFVGERKAFGDLRKAVVRDKDRKPIGWYLYYVSPGAVGEVVQIGCDSSSVEKVLDNLFFDAWRQGLTGLLGRFEPQFMQELTAKSCFFLRQGSWTLIHSKQAELLELFQSGSAFFSRLDGEWPLRPGFDTVATDRQLQNA